LDSKRIDDFGEYSLKSEFNDLFAKSLISGIRLATFNYKFVFLLWFANFTAGFIVSIPIYYIITDQLSNSSVGTILSEEFTLNWLMQFLYLYKTNIAEMPLTLLSTLGAYLLIQSFLAGGLISIFNLPEKNHSVDFFYGDGYAGKPQYGPFDGIIITAAIKEIPETLLRQLKTGGKLVAPVGGSDFQVMTLVIRDGEDSFSYSDHGSFVFVPMLKGTVNDN